MCPTLSASTSYLALAPDSAFTPGGLWEAAVMAQKLGFLPATHVGDLIAFLAPRFGPQPL